MICDRFSECNSKLKCLTFCSDVEPEKSCPEYPQCVVDKLNGGEKVYYGSMDKQEFVNSVARKHFGIERDPSGLNPSDPGAKLDEGKPKVAQILRQFARALWQVSQVGTLGAEKYSMGGWTEVDDGFNRYDDAQMRHWLMDAMGETRDTQTELLHLSHEAWNALAKLERYLRDNGGTLDGYKRP